MNSNILSKTKLLVVLIVFLNNYYTIFGQNGVDPEQIKQVIPPSPTAASLGKYGDIPANLFTGTPSINIPLYTLEGRDLTLPISLSYHASGVKVNEVASWVGLGWSLNAGGVITRSMRGKPDDDYHDGYLNTPTDMPEEHLIEDGYWTESNAELSTFITENKNDDFLPDIFNYNFNGHSGKFVFDQEGNVHLIPQQPIKVIPYYGGDNGRDLVEFDIIDEKGILYMFSSTERTNTGTGPLSGFEGFEYNSAWYLTGISRTIQTSGTPEITFEYEDEIVVQQKKNTTDMTLYFFRGTDIMNNIGVSANNTGPGWAVPKVQKKTNTSTIIHNAKRLKTIKASNNFEINFVANTLRDDIEGTSPNSHRLDKISIKLLDGTTSTIIKEFLLDYDNFATVPSNGDYSTPGNHSKRLRLLSVREKGSNGSLLPPYTFEYNPAGLPARNSYAHDYWGFYNGKTQNTDIPPKVIDPNVYTSGGADFSASPMHTQAGILTAITYPTGGQSLFEYESHDRSGLSIANLELKTSNVNDTYNIPNEYAESSTNTLIFNVYLNNVTAPLFPDQKPFLKYAFERPEGSNEGIKGTLFLKRLVAGGQDVLIYSQGINAIPPTGENAFKDSILITNLTDGQYKLEVRALLSSTTASAQLFYHETEELAPIQYVGNIPTGGVRIKKIISRTTGQVDMVKSYSYTKQTTDLPYPESSGILFQPYKFYSIRDVSYRYVKDFYTDECFNGDALYRYHDNLLSVSLAHGSHVGYSEVVEKNGQNGENGYTRYYYTTPLDIGTDSYPFAPKISMDHKRGLMTEKKVYNSDNKLLVRNTYNYGSDDGLRFKVPGMTIVRKTIQMPDSYTAGESTPDVLCINVADADEYIIRNSSVYSEWVQLLSETHTVYGEVGQFPITTTTYYEYEDENPKHYQATKVTKIVPAITLVGQTPVYDLYETRTSYPTDYFPSNCKLSEIVSGSCFPGVNLQTGYDDNSGAKGLQRAVYNNILTIPIENIQIKNSRVIKGQFNEYAIFSTGEALLRKQYDLSMPQDDYQEGQSLLLNGFGFSHLVHDATHGTVTLNKHSNYKETFMLDYTLGKITEYKHNQSGLQILLGWDYTQGLVTQKTLQKLNVTQDYDGDEFNDIALKTKYEYDPKWRDLHKIIDINNRYTKYVYDEFGRLSQTEYFGVMQPGGGISESNPDIVQQLFYHYAGETNQPNIIGVNPTNSKNYICTIDRQQVKNITYIDGLGRPIQKIGIRQGADNDTDDTNNPDIIQALQYDAFGRERYQFLPYTSSTDIAKYRTSAITLNAQGNLGGDVLNYYDTATAASGIVQISTTNRAYAETAFEASPLHRVQRQAAAGANWNMNSTHTINKAHQNYSHYWLAESTTDENGQTSTRYTDAMGKVRIDESALSIQGQAVATYYGYDDFDNIDYIASEAGLYDYIYDGEQRMIAKIIPGKEPELMVYDVLDRLVMQQDGNLRNKNRWKYIKYDELGRVIETGLCKTLRTHKQLQTSFNGIDGAVFPTFGINNLGISDTMRLTETTYNFIGQFKGQIAKSKERILDPDNLIATEWLTTTYTYDYRYRVTQKRTNNHLGGIADMDITSTNNRIDYIYDTFDNVIQENLYHYTPFGSYQLYKTRTFDNTNRLQAVENNNTGTLRNTYNAIGQLKTKSLHRIGNTTNYLQALDFRYNERGWLKSINQTALSAYNDIFAEVLHYDTAPDITGTTPQFNGNIAAIQVISAYPTPAGSLTSTQLTHKYTYDAINRLTVANSIGSNTTQNYSETFTYDPAGNLLTLQRNGKKNCETDPLTYGLIDNLAYQYDMQQNRFQLQQVSDAINDANINCAKRTDFRDNNNANADYAYDYNGNMVLDLNRKIAVSYNHLNLPYRIYFSETGHILEIVYSATGTKIHKRLCRRTPAEFRTQLEAVAASAQNVRNNKQSPYNGISTHRTTATQSLDLGGFYTHLQTSIGTIKTTTLYHTIDPVAVDIMTAIDILGEQTPTSCSLKHDYIGNIEYQNNQLEAYYTEEGRINLAASNRHEYTIKDHLGNARVCFTPPTTGTTPRIIQQTNYYAYGLPIGNLCHLYPTTVGGIDTLENKYQYNGIELEDALGINVDMARYRTLDPQLGRWWQIDPEVEQFYA